MGAYSGAWLAVASAMFAVQIYCDFSGYTMIAIGAAKIMGFRLMENFDCPYFSQTVAEFWRRWHISLTSWFRDYLYIPLGGNRKGKARKYFNILFVFLVSGLWHGAKWTYVIWGGLNGLYQVIGEITTPARKVISEKFGVKTKSISHLCLKTLVTFLLVDATWIFFRSTHISEAFFIIRNIFTNFDLLSLTGTPAAGIGMSKSQLLVSLGAIFVLFMADLLKKMKISVTDTVVEQNLWFRWLFYLTAVSVILIFGVWGSSYDSQAFIYFQF